tara:strand:+ start:1775 stop:1954 length:180 start_codon:yes stop_codon:yes gene_type:complete
MTIKPVEGSQSTYYVLLDDSGYPLAQGSRYMIEAIYQSLLRKDDRAQHFERLKFYGVII